MAATCVSGWDWASNSLGQNPCSVAGLLEAPCRGLATYNLGPLNASDNYIPPTKDKPLDCECNTVMYSLFQACIACQNNTNVETWAYWDANCKQVFVTQYPSAIPLTTKVPAWAYLNVTTKGTWNAFDSQALGDSPESTGTPVPTASLPGSSSSSGTGTGGNTGPTNTPAANSSHKSNTGAIAGGVVGGVVFLAIIGGLIAWFLVRKRRNAAAGLPPSDGSVYGHGSKPPYDYQAAAPYSPSHPEPQMRLYDPNDPLSFPNAAPGGDASFGGSGGNPSTYPATLYDPIAANQKGKYNGVPEL